VAYHSRPNLLFRHFGFSGFRESFDLILGTNQEYRRASAKFLSRPHFYGAVDQYHQKRKIEEIKQSPHLLISRVENGVIVPDLDVLETMTTVLGVPLYTLFVTHRQFLLKATQEIGPARGQ
jgi:hypothetical protein